MKRKKTSSEINTSYTFPVRTKCKYCFSNVKYYQKYQISMSQYHWKDHMELKEEDEFMLKNMPIINYPIDAKVQPKDFTRNRSVCFHTSFKIPNFALRYKNYKTGYHRLNDPQIKAVEFNGPRVLSCECGKTQWCYAGESYKKRAEVGNRHSKKKYPKSIFGKS